MEDEQIPRPAKLVCFELQGQEYAADIHCVRESLPQRPIARVPLTPQWLTGIINLRGDVVALIDLSLFLGMARTKMSTDSRIIIAQCEERRLGLVCDSLRMLRTIDMEQVKSTPATLAPSCAAMLEGVLPLPDGTTVQILNISAIFNSQELTAFRRGA
ncbi:MAG: purine-binding chemotaxis protein CheW [Kofleriaceae bacterium]|nr:purine-binding chemotaxis protein CheW [Kofleriaceae bacterium]